MFRGENSFGFLFACSLAVISVGCIGNKNKDVAVETEVAPPAAAYPDSPGYADTSEPTMTPTAPAPPSSSIGAATNNTPAPSAFELRQGEQLVEYQIQSGDTLEKIANQYNTSYRRIMAANGMASDRIIAGKTIQVPTSAPPANVAMNTPAQAGPSSSPSINPIGSISPPPVAPSAPSFPATGAPYPSTTAPPAVSAPTPSINIPNDPSSTSYPRVPSPQTPSQPATSFPTPSFGGSQY